MLSWKFQGQTKSNGTIMKRGRASDSEIGSFGFSNSGLIDSLDSISKTEVNTGFCKPPMGELICSQGFRLRHMHRVTCCFNLRFIMENRLTDKIKIMAFQENHRYPHFVVNQNVER